jgi:GTP cyclohydrolase II
MSNNPHKIEALQAYGIRVARKQHIVGVTALNLAYLHAKRGSAGHLIPDDLDVR